MNSLFNQDQTVYSFDASSLIEAYHSYPFERFPALWDQLEALARNDRLKMAVFVFDEVKDDGLKKWLEEKQLESYIRVGIDQIDQNKAQALIPILVDPKTGDSGADPWVIALAQDLTNSVVVTQEKISLNKEKPKIPNACADLDIECIDLNELIKRENWII